MTGLEARVINVLLVEDDPGDVLMTREAFDDYLHNRLDVVTDGSAALAYLRKEEPYADAPRPDLILLDLNLPRRDGREVLAEIKGDPELRRIPVVVLTTSEADELLSSRKLTKKQRQARRDQLAAQIMLTAYLESGGRSQPSPESIDNCVPTAVTMMLSLPPVAAASAAFILIAAAVASSPATSVLTVTATPPLRPAA